MVKFVITRERCEIGINETKRFVKFVAMYDTPQEAMDALYRGAKRLGLNLEVDDSVEPSMGFCTWMIYVQAGEWRYKVTEECDEDPFGLLA